ncbi:MAG: M23 family metallopeptidase [Anaerolineae bacterium]|nr:M23 family metallopeptidase [Anaerolineae bacterium]
MKRAGIAGFALVLCLLMAWRPAGAQGIEDTPLPADATQAPIITPTPLPRPAPVSTVEQDGTTVELFFSTIAQGQVGLVHVIGAGLAGARARLFDDLIDFFPVEGDGFYGLLAANMEQNPRSYDLTIFAWYDDNRRVSIVLPLDIVRGDFIRQDITMAPDRAYLVDAEIERGELAKLESIFSQRTPEHLWDARGFQMPILNSTLTSPFGAFRTFNGILQTRHTGWDIRTTLGVPVMASASGVVAYAGRMDIRGNIVVVDHGYGIFTTYNHLSQIHVTRGQSIVKGQIIGVTGDTGRSSGPHFHWEVAVNGAFVDSIQFTQTWLP